MTIQFPINDKIRLRTADDLVAREKASAALRELEPLLARGHAEAHALAGLIYEFGGVGVSQDFDKANYCYEFAARATGSGGACLGLARLHFHGKGRPVDLVFAHLIYESMRAENNEPIAVLGLVRIYLEKGWPHDDLTKAAEYCLSIIEKGYPAAHLLYARVLRKKGCRLRSLYHELAGRILGLRIMLADRGDIRLASE